MDRKKIEGIRMHANDVMECPVCKCDYLHHQTVEVYSRAAFDSEDGICVQAFPSMELHVDRDISRNPSTRRDGIRIYFTCEDCHHDPDNCPPPYEMLIYQHKGRTYIDTIYYVESHS